MQQLKRDLIKYQYILIKYGADVNKTNGISNTTALHKAAEEGHKTTVELLLNNSADPYMESQSGLTALDLAKRQNHKAIVTVLEKTMDIVKQKSNCSKIGKSFMRTAVSSAGSVGLTALATTAFATAAATSPISAAIGATSVTILGAKMTVDTIAIAAYGAAGGHIAGRVVRAATYDSDDEREDEESKTWTGWSKSKANTAVNVGAGASTGYVINKIIGKMEQPIESYTAKIAQEQFAKGVTIGLAGNATNYATREIVNKSVEVVSYGCRIL